MKSARYPLPPGEHYCMTQFQWCRIAGWEGGLFCSRTDLHVQKGIMTGQIYRNINIISARVGRDLMTVSRVWNRWIQDGNTERRAGSQLPPITRSREDKHATRLPLMDRAATSRALSQELGSFARQQISP
ncbi:HTH_Tnp_Tc3_2 domain-containing protein [Trichonephila clavipes]|uniref:HTH_Tnp_Tc3_2 domain-containing protein n=1 Tax=Trichonephila clavipes TaxID=2585209 RepID=A0A8X6SJH3_TRICX|nr:HTH_Tnp_Tc3_2 domain-containing protein [Trichonephila clavipes]